MAKILDGGATSRIILRELSKEAKMLHRPAGLGVVLAGTSRQSLKYVQIKKKAADVVGIQCKDAFFLDDLPDTQSVFKAVQDFAEDPYIDGILVQLPLPPNIDQTALLSHIPASKDVDGFHPLNMGLLALGQVSRLKPWETRGEYRTEPPSDVSPNAMLPCTAKAVLSLLDRYKVPIEGKKVFVIGRSAIAGLPISLLLMHRGAIVSSCDVNAHLDDIKALCRQADIVIAAAGSPELVRGDWVREGVVVVDVGFNVMENGVLGDVCFKEVVQEASLITPVPGGVGPMTVSMLMENTLRASLIRQKI